MGQNTAQWPQPDISEVDRNMLSTLVGLEKQYSEKEMELSELGANIKNCKKKLNISFQKQVEYCLQTGDGDSIIKTPVEVSECIASNLNFKADRYFKNNVSTRLSIMYLNNEIGRIVIGGKTYYGIMKYFKDKTTLKKGYNYLLEKKKSA